MEDIYKETAEKLWDILDDIDTLSDRIKPTTISGYKLFYDKALELVNARGHYMNSPDGQVLILNQEWVDSKVMQHLENKAW